MANASCSSAGCIHHDDLVLSQALTESKTRYIVRMAASRSPLRPVSGWYAQRKSAFNKAEKMAAKYPDFAVGVYEYSGPGTGVWHEVSVPSSWKPMP